MAALLQLRDFGIPERPDKALRLDGQPLSIVDEETFNAECDSSALTPATGVATVLYNWCPEALLALLDTENWFSFTWTLTINQGEDNETKFEIGRIRQQVTMGILDKEGLWKVMVTYDMTSTEHESTESSWQPNMEETMVDDKNVEDAAEVRRLGVSFVKDMILHRRWLTGKKMRHEFFVESPHIGMDPWEDGMRMNPRWLYESLDLSKCSTCTSAAESHKSLNRCGRCGTAAYCSSACQQRDWPVHKAVCTMSMEDRGKALHYSQHGGLANWRDSIQD
ncbi:hypothetical protein CKM354_000825100 [Cercospora kikuchii]|uniref:MYND-type domain-containing protein n=1 Tax=Cercospora kikuchii TaxID=84275 RepID=A0A9P3CPB9_9PEZI|nr:uncharacterized protein CKM354_000825100 [Cercospora kikuchii]GIZ45067.1 hypothetical protein CKM354_000825100 [Cercospora kikuchii]